MTDYRVYECDSCGKSERAGKQVVGWISVMMARMILPGMDKENKSVETKEFCTETCFRLGMTIVKLPELSKFDSFPGIAHDYDQSSSVFHDTNKPPGQYL